MKKLLLLAFLASPAFAQVLTDTPRGVVAAHAGRVELAGAWTAEGVANPTAIAASSERVAVLDALNDQAVIIDLATGRATRRNTAATPIAAAFLGRELFILARDGRVLQGERTAIPLAADPALLRVAGGKLYVYSRAAGVLQEIDGERIVRRLTVAPFASDLEIAGRTAYLVYPREARIRTVDLATGKAGNVAVGAVPVDLALTGGGTALTARVLAVADPSAKRVWLTEGAQSTAQAIARGFLRGFLGLGLYGNRASAFPTGVDRVLARGSRWVAYDSSSGTLYRIERRKSSVIAKGIAPGGFTLTAEGVAYWQDGRVRMVR